MSFPPHKSYARSGVEFLGDAPAHWKVRRLKYVCETFPSNVDKKSEDGQHVVRLCNYTDVYYNDQITADLDFMVATASPEQISKFALRAGDTIVTKDSETADDIAIAAYVPKDLPGVVCGYHLAMIRPRTSDVLGRFIKRVFDSGYAKASFAVRANGLTRVGLGSQALANVEIPVPPEGEQEQIAHFLDRETARIDTLIAKQERLIELLQEKRRALIARAVTRGLDPTVPMKDSGVEWVGEVPVHWVIKQLGYEVDLLTGFAFRSEDFDLDSGIALVRGDNVTEGALRWGGKARYWPNLLGGLERFLLAENDILIGMDGSKVGKNFARVREADLPLLLVQRVARLRVSKLLHPEFVELVIGSSLFRTWVDLVRTDPAIPHISPHDIRGFCLPIPPVEEQERIVRSVRQHCASIDALVDKARRMAELSLEHRVALISAAVTGKIDVRESAGSAMGKSAERCAA